jgi:spermidine/putrescine transport system ATP-binding protein
MGALIELRNLTKRFGATTAVDNVSLELHQGEVFSLLGPSGGGKTTLKNILAGFLRPDSGQVLVNGEDITEVPPNRRPINTVFQNYALFPHMTVRQNIAFGLEMAKRPQSEIDREVDLMLGLTELHDQAAKKPGQISGGQKQRVAIARALVNRPQLLLLDEPLAALDLKLRQHMLIELERIHREVGTTFLYITHDQGEAMSLSDRMAIMRDGRIEQLGTPEEVYETPRTRFVAGFVGDTNLIDATVETGSNVPRHCLHTTELGEIYHDTEGQSHEGSVFLADHRPALAPGTPAVLSLRPERIAVRRDRPGYDDGLNTICGVIEDLVYLGSRTHYRVRVGSHLLLVWKQHRRYLPDYRPIAVGETVHLSWHSDDGYLFTEEAPTKS